MPRQLPGLRLLEQRQPLMQARGAGGTGHALRSAVVVTTTALLGGQPAAWLLFSIFLFALGGFPLKGCML